MSDWTPNKFCKNEIANAIMNVAAELNSTASAVDGLLYGLKYGKSEGMSIAEALEVGMRAAGDRIASAIDGAHEHEPYDHATVKAGKAIAEAISDGLSDVSSSLNDIASSRVPGK